jgi:hypothetical protein
VPACFTHKNSRGRPAALVPKGVSKPYVMVSTILILKGSGVGSPSSLSGAPVGGCRLLMF